MFTLAVSFLIFAATAFKMVSTMATLEAQSLIGADIFARTTNNDPTDDMGIRILDERPMTKFLEDQMKAEGKPVLNYAFTSISNKRILEAVGVGNDSEGYGNLLPACDYVEINPYIYGIPENYLDVIYSDFYKPMEFQEGVHARELEDGKKDAISMLYNDDKISHPTDTDPNNIKVTAKGARKYNGGSLEEIKIVIPSGVRNLLQAGAGSVIRLLNSEDSYSYRAVVRALVSKIPGFYFSDYF